VTGLREFALRQMRGLHGTGWTCDAYRAL